MSERDKRTLEMEDPQVEKLHPDELRLIPCSEPLYEIDPAITVEITVNQARTSGRGSYSQAGYIPEGEQFDPKHPTSSFGEDQFVDGGHVVVGSGRHKRPGAFSGSGTIDVPVGTLCYQAGMSNSGRGTLTLFRAGVSGSETTCYIPVGQRADWFFSWLPQGSFVALPTDKVAPESISPHQEPRYIRESVGSRSAGRFDEPALYLSIDPAKGSPRWTTLGGHPEHVLVVEGHRHGRPEGTLLLRVSAGSVLYEIEKSEGGDEWRIYRHTSSGREEIQEDVLQKEVWEKYRTQVEVPELVVALPFPERPGQLVGYCYVDPDGQVIGSPAKQTEGWGKSRKYTMEQTKSKLPAVESGLELPKPLGGEFSVSDTGEWFVLPPSGDVKIQETYASGNIGATVVVSLDDIPKEAGMYGLYTKGDQTVIVPVSYQSVDQIRIASTPFEVWLAKESGRIRGVLPDNSTDVAKRNAGITAVDALSLEAQVLGYTWFVQPNELGELQELLPKGEDISLPPLQEIVSQYAKGKGDEEGVRRQSDVHQEQAHGGKAPDKVTATEKQTVKRLIEIIAMISSGEKAFSLNTYQGEKNIGKKMQIAIAMFAHMETATLLLDASIPEIGPQNTVSISSLLAYIDAAPVADLQAVGLIEQVRKLRRGVEVFSLLQRVKKSGGLEYFEEDEQDTVLRKIYERYRDTDEPLSNLDIDTLLMTVDPNAKEESAHPTDDFALPPLIEP